MAGAAHDHGYAADLQDCHFVLIGVADEAELWQVVEQLHAANIRHCPFYETSRDLGYTAVATVPLRGAQREVLVGYETLKLEELIAV